jgi:hypothetical protein
VQALVDHKKRFIHISLRPGSFSDKKLFINSPLFKSYNQIPIGYRFLGDAGYQLMGHVITPYHIFEGMPAEESNYNYRHSRTRITVENAFGLWKGKFRIFKTALNQNSKVDMAEIIVATMILHNWLIGLGESMGLTQSSNRG